VVSAVQAERKPNSSPSLQATHLQQISAALKKHSPGTPEKSEPDAPQLSSALDADQVGVTRSSGPSRSMTVVTRQPATPESSQPAPVLENESEEMSLLRTLAGVSAAEYESLLAARADSPRLLRKRRRLSMGAVEHHPTHSPARPGSVGEQRRLAPNGEEGRTFLILAYFNEWR